MSRIEIRDVRCEIRRLTVLLLFSFFLLLPCLAENDIAIIVNGDNIYKDEFDYAMAKYEDSYKRFFGDNMDVAVREKMKKELTEDLVNRQLYLQEAKRRGITAKAFAGEEEIEELLMSDPESTLEGKGIWDRAEKVILAYKMREIITPKVIASIKEDVSVSDKEVLDEYLKRAEKMRIKYLKIDPVPMAENMEISEDEIRSYYKGNSDQFKRPAVKEYAVLFFDPYDYIGMVAITPQMKTEYYKEHINDFKSDKLAKVKYVLFRTKDYTKQVDDLGVNLRKYYEENLDKFVVPAEARIKFISLKKPCDRKKLKSLGNELKRGIPFSELARKYSDDISTASNGGDLGYLKKGILKEPLNGIAFGLKSGQMSDIIETENNYCVFFVDEKKEEHVASFDEVKDKIEEQLLNESARPLALTDAKRFKIEARKIGFEKAAAQKGLIPFETDYFRSTDIIPTIGRDLLFTSTAISLASGEVSNEIDYNEGYVVLAGIDVKPQENLPFSEVSGSIERKILSDDSSAFAESAAKHALNLISEGVPIKELENRMSVHVATVEVSATSESPSNIGVIIKKSDGYYVTVLAKEVPSYIPAFDQVSEEVAVSLAMNKADLAAGKKAEELLLSGAITKEAALETGPFSMDDYVIDGEYQRPFIEQCFMFKAGQAGIIKSLGKYYVVQVLERGIQLSGYNDESAAIRSQVLKEKRAEYVNDWLEKEKEKARIQVDL
jgi:peptidyl-prolyl cis-trans isomerase D